MLLLQGKGIRLVQGGSEAAVLKAMAGMPSLQAVAQVYIPQPLLVRGSVCVCVCLGGGGGGQ